tara:strand:- start:22 stop:450 length:429 start_codon:yes stop_codon:yes gene_type:complete
MINYIISAAIILITLFILYRIQLDFKIQQEPPPIEESTEPEINIESDCIVILSQETCPYCKKLNEKIKSAKNKYTIIDVTDQDSFKLDDTFSSLTTDERENIISETKKLFNSGQVLFPTIISKNQITVGLPQDDALAEIFNV